ARPGTRRSPSGCSRSGSAPTRPPRPAPAICRREPRPGLRPAGQARGAAGNLRRGTCYLKIGDCSPIYTAVTTHVNECTHSGGGDHSDGLRWAVRLGYAAFGRVLPLVQAVALPRQLRSGRVGDRLGLRRVLLARLLALALYEGLMAVVGAVPLLVVAIVLWAV